MKKFILLGLFATLLFSQTVHAQSINSATSSVETMKGQVTQVLSSNTQALSGLGVTEKTQSLEVYILSGSDMGKTEVIENDAAQLAKGDLVFITHTIDSSQGTDTYTLTDPDRLPALLILTIIFIVLVVVCGGKQGIRGLISLLLSIFLILYVLLPGILHGVSPLLGSVLIASFIILIGSYITHGFNRSTHAAVIGMILTVIVSSTMAHFAIAGAHLTGFQNEEAAYLNVSTGGTIDFMGLLLGGILIGLLGVLYDAAIGQAVSVDELRRAAPDLSSFEIFKRAMRIGREHVGALVNTLAIAYVGVSLPLLLLFYVSNTGSALLVLNKELFATEVVRALIGSIGLVLAVPITTAIAIWIKVGKGSAQSHSHHHH